MGVKASEVVQVVCFISWVACSMLYSFQVIGHLNPNCCWDINYGSVAAPFQFAFFVVGYLFGIAYEKIREIDGSEANPENNNNNNNNNVFVFVKSTFRVALFVLVVAPFVYMKPQAAGTCTPTHVVASLLLMILEGHVIISLMRFYESCYGLLLGLISGVLATSYRGFGDGDHHYKVIVCLLSLLLIFLCDLYLSLRAQGASSQPHTPDPNLHLPPTKSTYAMV